MGREKKRKSNVKLRYFTPRDKGEKLGLIGHMGYIEDNSGMLTYLRKSQLAWRKVYSM